MLATWPWPYEWTKMTQLHQNTSLASQSKPKYSFASLPALIHDAEDLTKFWQKTPEIKIFDFCFFQISVSKPTRPKFFEFFKKCLWDCSRINQDAKNESEQLCCPSWLILGLIWIFGNHHIFACSYLKPRFRPNRSSCSSYRFRWERLKIYLEGVLASLKPHIIFQLNSCHPRRVLTPAKRAKSANSSFRDFCNFWHSDDIT